MRSSATASAGRPSPTDVSPGYTLERRDYGWCGLFRAMASPCEVHLSGVGRRVADDIVAMVHAEAMRIEHKFSRYRRGNIVDRINSAEGRAVEVDEETARLIDYAAELFRLSEGRFDITSGVLRRAWTFNGGEGIPDPEVVEALLERVGWSRVAWQKPMLHMAPGMEIDFGGIGKEYAVDLAAELVRGRASGALINFGGDLLALGPPTSRNPLRSGWTVGIESLGGGTAEKRIAIETGALATSGDSRRFVMKDGRRYGHILDSRTGWPVEAAPRSVTVLAPSCTEAGMLATFAMLMGEGAEAYLEAEGARHWILRS